MFFIPSEWYGKGGYDVLGVDFERVRMNDAMYDLTFVKN